METMNYLIKLNMERKDGKLSWKPHVNAYHKTHAWYESAIGFDIYRSKDPKIRKLTRRLYDEVLALSETNKQPDTKKQERDALKAVVLNLRNGVCFNVPVYYSRNKNDYGKSKRYRQLFFKYERLVEGGIDKLIDLGYIEHKSGRYNRKIQKGDKARMWASPALIELFMEYGLAEDIDYEKAELADIIILNKEKTEDEKKKEKVDIPETEYVIQIRDDLERYNEFVKQNYLTVSLNKDCEISYQFLKDKLVKSLNDNLISLNFISYNTLPEHKVQSLSKYLYQQYTINNNKTINPYHYNNTITKGTFSEDLIDEELYHLLRNAWVSSFGLFLAGVNLQVGYDRRKIENRNKQRMNEVKQIKDKAEAKKKEKEVKRLYKDEIKSHYALLSKKFPLKDIGIENMEFALFRETLYRVFNRGDTGLKYNGRAYGSLYQSIPKKWRRQIRINNERTVEVDYKYLHPGMAYNMVGEEYPTKDVYDIDNDVKTRDIYKIAVLRAINAPNEKKAVRAIRKALIEKQQDLKGQGTDISLQDHSLEKLIDRFKAAHPKIEKYVCSDKGTELMNIDSRIMNAILLRLMENGILGLNIFDSVVVAKRHEDFLSKVMIEEYERVMGYKPQIEVKH